MTWRDLNSQDPTDGICLSEIEYVRKHGNDDMIQMKIIHMDPSNVLRNMWLIGYKKYGSMPDYDKWLYYARNVKPFFKNYTITPQEYFANLKNALLSSEKLVPIIVFYSHFNNGNELYEGRHRALAAEDIGMQKIPIISINKNYY